MAALNIPASTLQGFIAAPLSPDTRLNARTRGMPLEIQYEKAHAPEVNGCVRVDTLVNTPSPEGRAEGLGKMIYRTYH